MDHPAAKEQAQLKSRQTKENPQNVREQLDSLEDVFSVLSFYLHVFIRILFVKFNIETVRD